jgi:lipopolysaccharide transport system permease protein
MTIVARHVASPAHADEHVRPRGLLARVTVVRWLAFVWVARDFSARYRQSWLGFAWSLVQPLFLLLVYGVIFTQVLHVNAGSVAYPVFAFCGLAPWAFVSSAVNLGVPSILTAQPIITKVWFPREVVPVAAVGVGVVDMLVTSSVLLVLAAFFGTGLHWAMLCIPIAYLGLVLIIAGIVIIASAVAVFVRDLRQITPLMLQMVFIGSPIMYGEGRISSKLRWVYDVNPIAGCVSAVRGSVVSGVWPSFWTLGGPVLAGVILVFISLLYMRSVEDRFIDVL